MYDDALQLSWAQAQQTQTPISLVMIDLDYFKKLNDALGHQAGDQALKQVAHILKKHLKRKTDLAARYGGEELAILLPDTLAEHACQLSEKIRKDIEALQIPNPETPLGILTASFGVAGWVLDASTQSRQLVHCADKMLYLAKTNGSNRCECTMEDNCPADDMG